MIKIIEKAKIKSIPKPDKSVVIIDVDEFEDILEQTDPKFQKSLKKSIKEYKNDELIPLKDL